FQAEDGIRDFHVTGVQTCALPILNEFTKLHTSIMMNPTTGMDVRNNIPKNFQNDSGPVFSIIIDLAGSSACGTGCFGACWYCVCAGPACGDGCAAAVSAGCFSGSGLASGCTGPAWGMSDVTACCSCA